MKCVPVPLDDGALPESTGEYILPSNEIQTGQLDAITIAANRMVVDRAKKLTSRFE